LFANADKLKEKKSEVSGMYQLLVVDDEPFVRKGIVTLIPYEQLGIDKVLEASNGQEAIRIVRENDVSLVLCDINMPKLNGLDFAKLVKEEKPWVKIAMITGYDYFDYAKQALKIGVEDYILKPVSKQDVFEVIANLIKRIEKQATMTEILKTMQIDSEVAVELDSTGYKKQIDLIMEKQLGDEDFSLSVLSDELGLSMSYLSSLFKKIYGIPFQDYILNERLEKSKVLLLSTSLKNYEIAEKVGIMDPNYFSTLFRKKFGVSPNQFKQKVLGKDKK
jgi:two-component system, response regulator YesN